VRYYSTELAPDMEEEEEKFQVNRFNQKLFVFDWQFNFMLTDNLIETIM